MKTRKTNLNTCCAAALAMLSGAAAVHGQCSSSKLMANDRQTNDFFGGAISLSSTGGVMIGVASDTTADGNNAGSVYTFGKVANVWGQLAHFYANDGQPDDLFGAAVGNADPMAVVGATGVGDTGAAYFFDRVGSTWNQGPKFLGLQAGESFGRAVAITSDNGGWAMVAAPLRDIDVSPNQGFSDPDAGEVAVFHKVNGVWTFFAHWPQRFQVNAGHATGEQFGSSVAIKGDIAVCGVPYGENINWPDNHGYIRVFRYNGGAWNYIDWLVSNNAEQDDHYGAAVATDGTFIAIGAPDDDATPAQVGSAKSNSGCAYVQYFHDGDWYIDGQVFASDATDNAHFGSSVSIQGDLMIVSASGAKKAYLFRRFGVYDWRQIAVYSDPDNVAGGLFAGKVAIRNNTIVIGDQWDDDNGAFTSSGAAYVFDAPSVGAASDMCDAAAAIPGHGNYTGCTTNATVDGTTTCGGGGILGFGPDVWYSWTPTCSGNVIIDTFGSDYDTVLSIHSACPEAGDSHTIACDDDANGGSWSLVTFNYSAGQTYLIRISGYNYNTGNFVLRVNEWQTPANDSCSSPQAVSTGTYTFSTCRATTDNVTIPLNCLGFDPTDKDVWFRYTAACNGTTTIDMCGSNFDTVVQVFLGTGCPGPGSIVAGCDDDGSNCPPLQLASRVSFSTLTGFQYMIRVGQYANSGAGDAVMSITCAPSCPVDYNQDGNITVPDIFAMLTGWFSHQSRADWNHNTFWDVPDIFAYLSSWFIGCP